MAVTPHSNNVTATEDVATSQNTAFFEKRFGNTTPNILKDYESVTYRISMGAVSGDSFKNASYLDDTANGKDSRFIVFGESGFTGTSNNKETKGSSNSIGKRVITAKGVPEYFIDNLTFKIMMPGNDFGYSGLAGGSFEVVEPYSLGLFFESLLASSIAAGFKHFNDNCPFILRIDLDSLILQFIDYPRSIGLNRLDILDVYTKSFVSQFKFILLPIIIYSILIIKKNSLQKIEFNNEIVKFLFLFSFGACCILNQLLTKNQIFIYFF